MQFARLIFVAVILPVVLASCQNSQTASNSYGGDVFDQPLNLPTSVKDVSPEAAKPQAVAETVPVKTLEEQLSLNEEVAATPAIEPHKAVIVAIAAVEPALVEELPIVALAPKKLTPQQRLELGRQTYAPIIAKHAKANGVPVALAMAVVEVESNYRPKARGRAGEIGLMQLLPRTARYIGYEGKMKHLYHPDTNIQYGMKYLGKAYRLGGGTTCGTILKYNAGHAAKRMNKISRHYCRRVQRILRQT
ncbi:MAG: transglycosylase SLT domain-containing protein [Rhizobiaceae bacterium]